jgi:anti-sigma regulatory factor (Ser/Thr protein kinase)
MTAMTLTCPDAVETVLPGAPRSVSEARALVRSELGASTLTEAAVLAMSELATNAITYSRSGLRGGTFGVTVQCVTDGVVIRVRDGGARTAPKLADPPGQGVGRTIFASRGSGVQVPLAPPPHTSRSETASTVLLLILRDIFSTVAGRCWRG